MLKQRVITAVLLLPLVLAAILLAPLVVFDAVVVVVLALMALEYGVLCTLSRWQRVAFVILIAGLYAAAVIPWQFSSELNIAALLAATFLWLLAPLWLATRTALPAVLKVLLGVVVLVGAGAALHGLKQIDLDGRWVLMVFVIVWAADIGGYAIGRLLGRHKLAPAISPGKTWEGFGGGLLFVLLVGFVASFWLIERENRLWWMLLLSLTAVISVVGDLIESLMKRQAGVKDSGSLLPGHGGVLDRLDSLLAVAPVFLVAAAQSGIFGELSGIGQ